MKILVTGRGGAAGSWAIRAEQLGAAMGAVVKPRATLADMRAADVVLVVKRVPDELLADLRRCGRPWAYDIVDAYPQPACSAWSPAESVQWLRRHLQRLQPDLVVWPNQRMRADGGGAGVVVYHHHRPGIEQNPLRPLVRTVGYEGAAAYLEGWREAIDAECRRLHATFVINPPSLAQVDVVLALRGGPWAGYCQQHWKSNVKLANAQASGTPFVGLPECGYLETASGGEHFVSTPAELGEALRALEPQIARRQAQLLMWSLPPHTVHQAARQTVAALEALCASRS